MNKQHFAYFIAVAWVACLGSGCFPSLPPEEDGGDIVARDDSHGVNDDKDIPTDVYPDVQLHGETETSGTLGVPDGLVVSSTLEDRIEVVWSEVPGADGYEIFRDDVMIAKIESTTLTRYEDRTASFAVASSWTPTIDLTATTDKTTGIELTWTAPDQPVGPTARFSVAAFNVDGSGPRSLTVEGRRAAPSIVAWEVERTITEGASTTRVTADPTTRWTDVDAPLPDVQMPTPTASDELHRSFIRLDVDVPVISPIIVRYRVRGRLAEGGLAPWSTPTTGQRLVVVEETNWESSSDLEGPWSPLADSSALSLQDVNAPLDGSQRFYRRYVSLGAGTSAYSAPVSGRRLAFIDVAVGGSHVCALTRAGRVWCWGSNFVGELGRGTTGSFSSTPTRVEGVDDLAAITVGGRYPSYASPFTCVATHAGDAWCWGVGYVASPTETALPRPTQISNATAAESIDAGVDMACILTTSEHLKCWGGWITKALGDGSRTWSTAALTVNRTNGSSLDNVKAFAVGGGFGGCAISLDTFERRRLDCWPDEIGRAASFSLPENETVAGLWRGGGTGLHRCVLSDTGAAWCWGSGLEGQLGQGVKADSNNPVRVINMEDSPIVEISVGLDHTCALQIGGSIRCWGTGAFGQLGHGQNGGGVEALTPVEVVGTFEDAQRVSAGGFATCAIMNHTVYCWGRNDSGQLGTGDTVLRNRPTPILVP